ncbi:MAG: ABC transporter ATP-binding protein [Acidimicrobiia bacterium]
MDDPVGHAARDQALLSAPSVISVAGVSMRFPGKRSAGTVALDGVDLSVAPGEFVSILGPSGCGKSTLLRIVAGLVTPTAGRLSVAGTSPDAARAGKQFAFVPQAPALLPWRTVAQNVRLLTEVNRSGVAHSLLPDQEVRALIDEVGLGSFLDALPHELSGGMQQRVSLVRAFALGAPILLMDEPFAALDEITRSDMRYLLLRLWERTGNTVVFITHSIDEAVVLSDRVALMTARPGRIGHIETIELPRPRHEDVEDTAPFHEHVRNLRHRLREGHR